MVKGRKSTAVDAPRPVAEAGPYKPDDVFQPVSAGQPKLDVSGAGLDGDQELWLLQLPLDFPVNTPVEWAMCEDGGDGVRGRCTVNGTDYLLVPEQEALSSAIYATPASPSGALVPVARRLAVVRSTPAPLVCFGEDPAADAAAAAKRARRQQQQQRPAPPPLPSPQQEAQQQQQQQHEQQQQQAAAEGKQKGKKRKAAEGGAPAAAVAAATPAADASGSSKKAKKEKKEKKDKSAKKEKKEKRKD